MARINQNFTKFKGDDFELRFTIEDAGNVESYDALWICDSSPMIVKSSQGGTPAITISENVVTVEIESSDTSGLTAGQYQHQLQLDDNGEGGVVSDGTFTLREKLEE